MKKKINKIFKIYFPDKSNKDMVYLDDRICEEIILCVRGLVKKEKDRLIFDNCAFTFLTRNVFWGTDLRMNDSIKNIKKAYLRLVKMINE